MKNNPADEIIGSFGKLILTDAFQYQSEYNDLLSESKLIWVKARPEQDWLWTFSAI